MGFILNQLEKRSSLENPAQYIIDYFSGGVSKSSSGVNVTENNADSCIAFGACIDRISKQVATMPLDFYKRKDTSRFKATDHPLYALLKYSPNPEMTSYIWRLVQTRAYLTWGVCYSKIERDLEGIGDIKALWPIPPKNVRARRNDKTKEIEFEVWKDDGSAYTIIKDHDMFRIFFNTDDGVKAKSPVRTYAESIGLAIAEEKFGAMFFGSGANMAGILTVTGKIDPAGEKYKHMRQSWDEIYSGISNSHKTVILEEGTKYERIGIPPNESQFMDARVFQTEEIARIFDMPLDRIQLGYKNQSTYNNAEQEDLKFMKFCIMPHTSNWEQELMRHLLGRSEQRRYFFEFNFDIVLKADTKTRSDMYHQQIQDGVICADEVREKENMNPQEPYKEGDSPGKQYFINSAMMPKQLVGEYFESKIKAADKKDGDISGSTTDKEGEAGTKGTKE
jgi:HK97 family phage portal protein